MTPTLEETVYFDFITSRFDTGAVTDADSTPSVAVFEDANDTAILSPTPAKRTSLTGNYRVAIPCTAANGFEVGKSYNVIASATVNSVAGKGMIGRFQVRGIDIDDVPTAAAIADAVLDEALSGHTTSGSAGERIGRIPNAAAGGSGGLPTVDASNRVAGIQGTINTLDGLDTAQDAQHATTQGAISGLSIPTAGAIADQVWEEAIADHSGTAGSTAEALGAAGSAGDPWTTALPGSYTSGQAGKIVGDALDAAVSSRAVAGDAMALTSGERTTLAAVIWNSLTSGMTTAGSIGKKLADWTIHSAADVWAVATRVLTAGTNIVLAKGTGVTGFNDVSSSDVQTAAAAALTAYDPPTRTELTSDIASVLSAIGTLNDPTAAAVAAAVLAAGDIDGYSLEEAQKLQLSALCGVLAGAGGTTVTIEAADGSKTRITATVDSSGNRSGVTLDETG